LQNQNTSYTNLQIDWWLYTTCENTNPYSVFGAIRYIRWWITGYIVAGTKLEYQSNHIIAKFAKSLQYFDNKVIIGYIYDSNGGIGYVGGSLTGHEDLINFLNSWWSINSGFTYSWDTIISNNSLRTTTIESWNTAMETMRNLIIQWSVGLSKSINIDERSSLLGNFENKTVIYNGSDVNSSTVINFARQKAQQLCQGKEINLPISTNETILCYENIWLTIDLAQTTTYENKTIIVKSGSVILSDGMQENSPSLDIFIDKGILYLPQDPFTQQTFNDQWFPDNPWITSWLYLKGNFLINGLILWWTPGWETWFDHKLHLKGKLTTLNTPLQPNSGRINQINALLGVWYDGFINLQKVFTRKCRLNGIGSDGSQCATWGIISTTPLVILNGNYPSNILQ
jgi:hypothetical protein